MPSSSDTHFCKACNNETPYSEVLVRKPSKYDSDPSLLGRIKLFAHTCLRSYFYLASKRQLSQ